MLKLAFNRLKKSHSSAAKMKNDDFTEINMKDVNQYGRTQSSVPTTDASNNTTASSGRSGVIDYTKENSQPLLKMTSDSYITKSRKGCLEESGDTLRIHSKEVASRLAEKRRQNRLRIARAGKSKLSKHLTSDTSSRKENETNDIGTICQEYQEHTPEKETTGTSEKKTDKTMKNLEFLVSKFETKLKEFRSTADVILEQADEMQKVSSTVDRSDSCDAETVTADDEDISTIFDFSSDCLNYENGIESVKCAGDDDENDSVVLLANTPNKLQKKIFVRGKVIRRLVNTPVKRLRHDCIGRNAPKLATSPIMRKIRTNKSSTRDIIMEAMSKDDREFTFC